MKFKHLPNPVLTVLVAALFLLATGCLTIHAADLSGTVQLAGIPVAGASVTLYAAGTGAPAKVAEIKTDNQGVFKLSAKQAPKDSVLYVIAKGPEENVALLSVT